MEAFGRIIIEGMAHGKFVIAARSGANVEFIEHEKTGLLYQPGNPEDLNTAKIMLMQERINNEMIRKSISWKVTGPIRYFLDLIIMHKR